MVDPNDPQAVKVLVEKAAGGDRDAFDALAQAFSAPLRDRIACWIQFRIGPRVDPDDVLQETFLRALKAVERFEWLHDDAFLPWLTGVAKNALADIARKAKQQRLRQGDGGSVSKLPAGHATRSQEMRRDERFERFASALDKLPDDYRDVLTLARLEGLTMKEIAKRMDRTPNSVKHLIARALRALKKQFGDTESFHLPDRRLEVEGERHGE